MADIPAARGALRILTHLARQGGPVAASAIARDLGLPRSSTYQLIRVMQDEGYVVHYPELRAYGLGSLVSEIGSSVLRATRLGQLAQPLLDRLVADVGQSGGDPGPGVPGVAQLGVLHGSDVSYVSKAAGHRAPTTVASVGVRLPAHLTATGRSMLAALPAGQVRALFPHRESLVTRRGLGPTTLRALDEILAVTRSRGFAVEDGEITLGYSSVAAAATDRNGYPVAAIGLTFLAVAAPSPEDTARLGAAVVAAAGALTARLGGR